MMNHLNLATAFAPGLMGPGDKQKLDSIDVAALMSAGELVTPENFGATGGSSTPGASSRDNVAIQNMLSSGKPCFFDKYYSVDTDIIADFADSQVGAYIQGLGTRSGLVLYPGGSLRLEGMNQDNPIGWHQDQYSLQNFTIFVNYNGSKVPLTLKADAGDSGSHSPGVNLTNVNVNPTSTSNGSTNTQIELINIRQGSLVNVATSGRYGLYSGNGIVHTVDEGSAPVEISNFGVRIAHVANAFVLKPSTGSTTYDDAQGHHWFNCTALAVNRGWDLGGGPEGFGEWANIQGCHALFREIGIYGVNYGNIHAANNYLLAHGGLGTCQGIAITGSSIDNYLFLTNNRIRMDAATGANRYGINTAAAFGGFSTYNKTTGATNAYGLMAGVTSVGNT